MSGNASRNKGRRGQTEAALLLQERDYSVLESSGGRSDPDFFATKHGITWAVEVKNTRTYSRDAATHQAKDQAKRKKARWMLMWHIPGSHSWLVERQGLRPSLWHRGES